MNISVFCGATLPRNPEYINAAHQLGILLAQHGHTLLYGGSNLGLMGVVSSATLERGGHVVGVIPSFFSEEIILSQPVSELVRVATIADDRAITPAMRRSIQKARQESARGETIVCRTPEDMQKYFDSL